MSIAQHPIIFFGFEFRAAQNMELDVNYKRGCSSTTS